MKLFVRALITALMFVLILRSVELGEVWDILQRARPGLLVAALLSQFLGTTVASYRWYLVMRNLGFGQGPRFYWGSYFKGTFFNQGLPTSIGGDAVRILDVAKLGFRKRDAFYAVFVDRVFGLVSLVSINLIALAAKPGLLPRELYYFVGLVGLVGLSGFTAAMFIYRLLPAHGNPWLGRVRILSQRLHQAASRDRSQILVFSLLVHLCSLLCIYTTALSLGLPYGFGTYLVIVPPAFLFTLIPISLAGWGVREGAMVALFSLIGADKAAVLTLSVLYGLTLIVTSLPGLLVYLWGHHRLALSA